MSADQIPAVDVVSAAAASDVVMLDVREYEEWMSGRAPTAVHMTGGMSARASFGHPLVNHAGNPGVVI